MKNEFFKKKNKKGQILIYLFSIGVLVLFLALAIIPSFIDTVDESMETEQLNCSEGNLTKEQKASCTSIELYKPYFIGALIGLAGLIVMRAIT